MMTIEAALPIIQAVLNATLIVWLFLLFRYMKKMRKMYDMHNKLYDDYQKLVLDLQIKTRELLGKQSDDA